jgi:hypothetical protein
LPFITRVAFAFVVVATTGTSVVPTGKDTVCLSTTADPFTVKTDSEVSALGDGSAAEAWMGITKSTVAARIATAPRARLINELKALPSQES